MKIHFVLDEQAHSMPDPIYVSAMGILADRGFTISSGIPEDTLLCPERLCARHDLYVLQSRSELALSIAGVLHDRGGRFLNAWPAFALAQNRILAASRLAAAGVPVPRCWVTGDFARLCDLAAERPVIVKPYRARSGGVQILAHTPDDLAGIALCDHPVLVQEYVEGPALRVQVIGSHVFASSHARGNPADAPGTSAPVPPALRELALRCGRAFGLQVYGFDVIASPEGPRVVDVDPAPALRGLPRAAALLARRIEDSARAGVAAPARPPAVEDVPAWAGCLQPA